MRKEDRLGLAAGLLTLTLGLEMYKSRDNNPGCANNDALPTQVLALSDKSLTPISIDGEKALVAQEGEVTIVDLSGEKGNTLVPSAEIKVGFNGNEPISLEPIVAAGVELNNGFIKTVFVRNPGVAIDDGKTIVELQTLCTREKQVVSAKK